MAVLTAIPREAFLLSPGSTPAGRLKHCLRIGPRFQISNPRAWAVGECSQLFTRSTEGSRSFSQPGHLDGDLFQTFWPMVERHTFCIRDARMGDALDK